MSRTVRWIRRLLLVAVSLFLLAAAGIGYLRSWHRHRFPYGPEHVCSSEISVCLQSYAGVHEGRFPTGGETPEASLSLLYPECCSIGALRGKGYPEGPARELLESGQPLTPETCGWQYVDGLSKYDGVPTSWVIIVWDKIGLGHNSELLPYGGHTVIFMDGHEAVVCEADWPRVLAGQEAAWAAIRRREEPPLPWLPDALR